MKRIELIQDEAYDRVIVFIYNTESKVVGLNFHQGVDDLDTHYMKNDAELFGIFDRMCVDVEHQEDLIVVANEAIEEYMIIKNADVREMIIDDLVIHAVTNLSAEVLYRTYTAGEDLDDCDVEMINMTKEALKRIYTVIVEKRYKHGK